MRYKVLSILSFVFLLFFKSSCNQSTSFNQNDLSANNIYKTYKERLADYPRELISHFPKELTAKKISFSCPAPAGYYALHYSGFELFINYTDNKEKYLEEIKDKFIDTSIFQESNVLFLSTICDYCDSTESEYVVYPYPDIQNHLKVLSEVQEEKIQFSLDLKDYTYYLIEKKDTIIYEEQKTNYCPLLEKELGHGYSRGVMVNEKDKILFYWLYFW